MHHVRSSIVTALIVLTGLLAGAASASAYGEQPFKIVYDNDSTRCLEAVKDSSGVWWRTMVGSCESRYDPNRTTYFTYTSAHELRPLDNTVVCIGGPPCFADRCIDDEGRQNNAYLEPCSGAESQQYVYTAERQLANAGRRCITGGALGGLAQSLTCSTSNSQQRWSLK